ILYHDANNNGLPDTNERVDSVRYTSSLDAAASDSITLHWLPTSEGNISLIVKLDSTTVQPLTDEDGSDNTHTLNALIYPRPDSITFSEIMFDPLGSEDSNEFIELYNFGTHAVDLLNWKIADSLGYDAIQDAGNGTVLQAGQYAIVFENEYTLNTGRYTSRIPSSALVLTINGSTFGSSSSGLVGTYPKQLFLVRSLGDTISTYRYSLDNTEGHSDTKINPSAANASVNWMNSLITDGTPGAHAEVNLSVLGQRLRFAPSEIPSGTQTVISVTVKDSGIAPVNIFKIAMYHDTNRNATPEPEEIIDSLVFSGQLYYGDSVIFTANTPTLSYGVHYFIARISQGEVSPYGDTLYYNDMLTDSIRTQPSGDIALNRGRLILGEIATRGNSFPIGAYAYNMGTQPVQSFTVRWYEDRDGNYTTAPEERIDSSTYAGNLLPGDSTFLQINYPNATYGKHRIMVEVISTSVQPIVDEEPSNNLLVDSLEAGARARDILISEFMYLAVTDSIPEWIEIYNPSALSISLMNWQLYDKTSHVVLTERSDTLHTGQFGIIVKDSTLFHKKYGEALSDVLYIYPTSMPSLNNTGGDIIKLSTPAGLTVDSLNYLTSWGDDEGISLERKLNDSASYSMSNWALSSDPSGGTPGTKNTATPQLHDLSITSRDILWTPAYPTQGEVFQIKATVRNLGVTSSGASAILLYAYSGADSTLLQTTNSPAILPGDSLVIVSSPITNGPQTYVGIQIDYAEDERLSNNFAKRFVPAATPRQTVIINEIMYKPGTGHTEWIELYNRSQNAVDLRSWRISDGNADLTAPATAKTITVQSVILQPDSFIIIAKDSVQFSSQYGTPLHAVYLSSMPALNDPGDMITIQDSLGSIVDSLVYLSGWGGSSDRTLERRFYDSVSYLTSNWLSCESPIGATPGHPNSVKPLHYDISLNASPLHVTPSYPRIGEPFTITAPIYNQGLEPVNDASLRWLRIRPQHDTLILSEQIIGMLNAGDSLKTSYSDTARQIGDSIVALILSVSDERTLNNKSAVPLITSARRNALVINEIMYDPGSNRPEWIELYNPGADTVDLKNWRLADESTIANPKTFAGTSLRIPSQHYVIITKDASALALSYPLLSSPVVTMTSFPTLNQTGDLILLTDSLSVTVDSVFYENTWGGANGFSIERISATDDANSPNNWKTSEANAGATPGGMNSTTPVALDLSIRTNDVWFDPPFPSPGQPVQIHMRIRNKGLQNITNAAVVRVYNDINNDSIPQITEIIDSTTVPVLLAGDSQSVTIQWTIPASASRRLSKAVSMGSRKIIIQLDFASDERTENNLLFTALPLGTPFQSIVINEFMYETDTSRTEFIELYNPGTTAWDLKDWKIADGSSVVSIADVSVSFLSGAYKVLAPDSSFFRKFSTTPASSVIIVPGLPSLNNTGDAIRLADDLGATVDSLTYSNTWGGSKNISVERIDADVSSDEPNNWTTSLTAQGHTAGSVNSIVSAEPFVKQSLIINEIMFSPLSGEPEYIELYNRSETAISLLNWAITVGDDKTLLA
ncbi:MAG TPA: lamin tail domain-containing protein, partial [bacterium]|nr:lamin tail domain-containing protein [bacterium]